MGRTPVALVVPYHNEERFLPRLIASLREQRGVSVPVVFVDNASTDGSAAIVQGCDEARRGQWICIEEKRVGKFFAMRTAAAFCAATLRAEHVVFLDADSYCADSDWVANCIGIAESVGGRCGYTYSPFMYVGTEHLPTFALAYHAYQAAVNDLMERTGWTAPGMGFLCAGDVLSRYFAAAHIGTEIDLRLSLLALCEGREAVLNAGSIMSAARRIIVNRRNFYAWCFYEPSYYLNKDINVPLKLNLNTPGPVEDLPADMVARFFERRALKVASRHLIPAVLFDRTGAFLERVGEVFGTDVSAGLHSGLGRLGGQGDLIFSNRFESIIRRIERHPVCADLTQRIAGLMHRQYSGRLALPAAAL